MLRLCLHTQTGIQYYPDEIKQLLINSGLYKLVYISGYNPQSIFFYHIYLKYVIRRVFSGQI